MRQKLRGGGIRPIGLGGVILPLLQRSGLFPLNSTCAPLSFSRTGVQLVVLQMEGGGSTVQLRYHNKVRDRMSVTVCPRPRVRNCKSEAVCPRLCAWYSKGTGRCKEGIQQMRIWATGQSDWSNHFMLAPPLAPPKCAQQMTIGLMIVLVLLLWLFHLYSPKQMRTGPIIASSHMLVSKNKPRTPMHASRKKARASTPYFVNGLCLLGP